ncbi:GGDEF domain-containing protein [Oceanobacillus saliphilus]|uniref:GGDEF domain-containing protein n=1 Tax=Oceanobacillus saliphilus TaxID=2925834 RepID=UPI00201DEE6A|nr:GGDEF domain-containing protein [Oceanobacillus saliphilus]
MYKLKAFIIGIFIFSMIVAIAAGPIDISIPFYFQVFFVYLLFTTLYSHLKTVVKTGNVNLDYSISYGLSFVLIAGPLGLFLFEIVNRFYVYFYRKKTGTADEDEFLHTFYNIGGPALLHSLGYFIFFGLYPYVEGIPFGYWGLLVAIVAFTDLLSSLLLLTIFHISGNTHTGQEAWDFIKGRSILDTMKKAVSNGLLFIFLLEQRWEVLFALFILNYLVSRSAVLQSKTIQHKIERDRFEQMAYTDFLTKVHNRTYMNKIMNELDDSDEEVGIIVSDIDTFKRINDTYNHAVGDCVIQHFAMRLKSFLRDDDYLFRSGGEEFTIILRNRDYKECMNLVQELQKGIENTPAVAEFRSKRITISYTASFGLYYYKSNPQTDIKKAYIHADDLLFNAKNEGKNQVSVKNGIIDLPLSARYCSTTQKEKVNI